MNFNKPKEEVISEAYSAAMNAVYNQTNYIKHNTGSIAPNTVVNAIEMAIMEGITAAIRSLVENTYTDQEFEEDLKLRS